MNTFYEIGMGILSIIGAVAVGILNICLAAAPWMLVALFVNWLFF